MLKLICLWLTLNILFFSCAGCTNIERSKKLTTEEQIVPIQKTLKIEKGSQMRSFFETEAKLESQDCQAGKPMNILVSIQNTGKLPIPLMMKSCGYDSLFETDSEIVKIAHHTCFSDGILKPILAPGEILEKRLRLYFSGTPSYQKVIFKIGFTPQSLTQTGEVVLGDRVWTKNSLSVEYTNNCPTDTHVTSPLYD